MVKAILKIVESGAREVVADFNKTKKLLEERYGINIKIKVNTFGDGQLLLDEVQIVPYKDK